MSPTHSKRSTRPIGPTLLCAANYPANTGYAWDFIESLYAGVADELAPGGIRTFVAYPSISEPPRALVGSAAQAIVLDARLRSWRSVFATARFVRRLRVKAVYLTDRPAYSPKYGCLRLAGVRRIVVHRHNAGGSTAPRGLKRLVKWVAARVPFCSADLVVAVSDDVVRRQRATTLAPPRRFLRVWNGVPLREVSDGSARETHALFDLAPDRPLFACACRAVALKGVAQLLRAFDRLIAAWPPGAPRPALLYIGDGPQFNEIKELHGRLASRGDIVLTGYRSDADRLIAAVDVCVTASIAKDAFPLSVLQPMAMGKPVIGTAIGGIPEMIEDGVTGLLVAPSNEEQLAAAMVRLAQDPELTARLGRQAHQRVAERFDRREQIRCLAALVDPDAAEKQRTVERMAEQADGAERG